MRINPKENIYGQYKVSPDISITHRAIILGALAKGKTYIINPCLHKKARSKGESQKRGYRDKTAQGDKRRYPRRLREKRNAHEIFMRRCRGERNRRGAYGRQMALSETDEKRQRAARGDGGYGRA